MYKNWKLFLWLAINLFIIFFGWWQVSGARVVARPDFWVIAAGRFTGLLAVFFVLVEFLLIGRVKWIERVSGYDRLSRWHHWIGLFALFFIALHPFFLVWGYADLSGSTWRDQMSDFARYWPDVGAATVGAILFFVVVVSSIAIVARRMKYEFWYFIHLLVYVALFLSFSHQVKTGGDFRNLWFVVYWYILYGFVFINLGWYRFLLPIINFFRFRFVVDRVVRENDNIWSIYIKGRNLDRFDARCGQFVIVRFLERGSWWQAHPFSLSCSPRDGLRLSVKILGDFSGLVGKISPGTRVVIDGPHGVFVSERCCGRPALLVAGGIGIAPVRALAQEMGERGIDAVLLYGVKSDADLVFYDELEKMVKKFPSLSVRYVVGGESGRAHAHGRIDRAVLLRFAPDAAARDLYVCGPSAMMKSVVRIGREIGIPRSRIYFEKFSFGG